MISFNIIIIFYHAVAHCVDVSSEYSSENRADSDLPTSTFVRLTPNVLSKQRILILATLKIVCARCSIARFGGNVVCGQESYRAAPHATTKYAMITQ